MSLSLLGCNNDKNSQVSNNSTQQSEKSNSEGNKNKDTQNNDEGYTENTVIDVPKKMISLMM